MDDQNATQSPPDDEFGTFALRGIARWWLGICQNTRSRKLNNWLRKPLKRLVHGWVDTQCWGLNLRLSAHGNISEQRLLYWPEGIDLAEREAIRSALASGGVFLDIGANAGLYSLWIASDRNADVQVEAFEPDAGLCNRIKGNLVRNGLINVRLHEYALGAREGSACLLRDGKNLGCNQVNSSETHSDPPDINTVPMHRLPEVLKQFNITSSAVIKIDVEGAEKEILEPLFAELPSSTWPSLIVCELERRHETTEAANLLLSLGYKLRERTRMNGIFELPRSSEELQSQAA